MNDPQEQGFGVADGDAVAVMHTLLSQQLLGTPTLAQQLANSARAGAGANPFLSASPQLQYSMQSFRIGSPGFVSTGSAPGLMASPARKPMDRGRGTGALPRRQCNCKNSRCLKLYCECFASGGYCDQCNCVNCCNNPENEHTRQSAIEAILERNPNAFRPKIQEAEAHTAAARHMASPDVTSVRHTKGCNCKKSTCLKKYCECFQAGIFCSDICKCMDCKNYEGSEARAHVLAHQEVGPLGPPSVAVPGSSPFKRARSMGPPTGTTASNTPTAAAVAAAAAAAAAAGFARQSIPGVYGGAATPAGMLQQLQASLTARPSTHQVVGECVKHNVIEELCNLLILVADEEAEKQPTPPAAGAEQAQAQQQPGTSDSSSMPVDGASQQQRQGHQQQSGSAHAGATLQQEQQAQQIMLEAQERAVLEEFLSILRKIVEKAAAHAPTPLQALPSFSPSALAATAAASGAGSTPLHPLFPGAFLQQSLSAAGAAASAPAAASLQSRPLQAVAPSSQQQARLSTAPEVLAEPTSSGPAAQSMKGSQLPIPAHEEQQSRGAMKMEDGAPEAAAESAGVQGQRGGGGSSAVLDSMDLDAPASVMLAGPADSGLSIRCSGEESMSTAGHGAESAGAGSISVPGASGTYVQGDGSVGVQGTPHARDVGAMQTSNRPFDSRHMQQYSHSGSPWSALQGSRQLSMDEARVSAGLHQAGERVASNRGVGM